MAIAASETTTWKRAGVPCLVAEFEIPADLGFNRGKVADPQALADDFHAASWLYMCGEEFAGMEGGMDFAQVEAAVPVAERIVSDPPVVFDLGFVQQHLAALDELPRPTLVTCRAGPRSSALVYLYAGLQVGATADEVLARADADEAPFVGNEELRDLVRQGLDDGVR
jgi:hypothetical protein